LGRLRFWVDDKTAVGPRQQLDRVESILSQKYGTPRWTLGIGVARDRNTHTISPSQEEYINNLMERSGIQYATTITTLEPGAILTKDQWSTTPAELQEMS